MITTVEPDYGQDIDGNRSIVQYSHEPEEIDIPDIIKQLEDLYLDGVHEGEQKVYLYSMDLDEEVELSVFIEDYLVDLKKDLKC